MVHAPQIKGIDRPPKVETPISFTRLPGSRRFYIPRNNFPPSTHGVEKSPQPGCVGFLAWMNFKTPVNLSLGRKGSAKDLKTVLAVGQ
jgi:hypothetical protein